MIEVYVAKNIITMNPSLPEATAIAVRDGEILEVGSLESLSPWLIRDDYQIIETFQDCVIVPGFIDPHLHPAMAAVILPMHFITAMPWTLPWCEVPASLTSHAFDQEMQRISATVDDEILIFWGFWHLLTILQPFQLLIQRLFSLSRPTGPIQSTIRHVPQTVPSQNSYFPRTK